MSIEKIQNIQSICLQKNLRFTALRSNVLEIIITARKPVKAYDILDQLRQKKFSAKPITVYRTLDFLLQHAFIHKLDSINAFFACLHPLEHNECYFFLCNKCGKINEIFINDTKQIMQQIKSNNNFIITKMYLELSGECKNCEFDQVV